MKTKSKGRDQLSDAIVDYDGRVMPHALDCEEAVLGAILMEGEPALCEVRSLLAPQMFYNPAHSHVYEAICAVADAGIKIDLLTVREAMVRAKTLKDAGGAPLLAKLTLKVGSAANLDWHAKIVVQKYIARRTIEIGYDAANRSYDGEEDVADIITAVGENIDKLADIANAGAMPVSVAQCASDAVAELQRRVQQARSGRTAGISTGLVDLNTITGGWQNGNLIILAARPSVGKTALMLHCAQTAARAGVPAVIFSCEMTSTALAHRIILTNCDVDSYSYRSGRVSDAEVAAVSAAVQDSVADLPLYIQHSAGETMEGIAAKARLLKRQGRCGIVFIDYLQLLKTKSCGRDNYREREIAEISRMAKRMAGELDVPVVLLSQLNRDIEKRKGKEPMLSDLRESGAIEQDADIVVFIHRDSYQSYANSNGEGKLIVAKNRDGITGVVQFKYNAAMTKFFDVGEDDGMPF